MTLRGYLNSALFINLTDKITFFIVSVFYEVLPVNITYLNYQKSNRQDSLGMGMGMKKSKREIVLARKETKRQCERERERKCVYME